MNSELINLIGSQIIEQLPYEIAIIDRNLDIIKANKSFEEYFGDWRGKKCYQAYKKSDKQCLSCKINEVFSLNEKRISNETGYNKHGKLCYYVVNQIPLKSDNGEVRYVMEMSTDVTKSDQIQREYSVLFENVPSYVTIIDRNYKIIKANKKFRDTFGEVLGKHCYEVYKKRHKRCKHCPAAKTFKDRNEHFSSEVGITHAGEETQYIVNTTPLSYDENGVQLIIEIATDITELNELQIKLRQTYDYYVTLIQNSGIGVIALDEKNNVIIFNPSVKKLFNWISRKKPTYNQLKQILPPIFFNESKEDIIISNPVESTITRPDGTKIPVRFSAINLFSKNLYIGKAAFLRDLSDLKEMEKQMIDADRLSTVGQTVAGLAHTIKNLLMGLEGGMYIVDSGLRKGNANRIMEGWEILQRNFSKTTDLVRGFLSFAKGRLPELKKINPNILVKNIYDLYYNTALNQNVKIITEYGYDGEDVYLDPDGIETCLTNLLSNAIDAATMREDKNGEVIIRTYKEDDNLVYEVKDNGVGIDSEVIQNIFTTFFTTKGNKGTGLGLLTTNKIVKEHYGKIDVKSDLGVGSTFRIVLNIEKLKSVGSSK